MRGTLHIGLPKTATSLLQSLFDPTGTSRGQVARCFIPLSEAFNSNKVLYEPRSNKARGSKIQRSDASRLGKSVVKTLQTDRPEYLYDFLSLEGICGFSLSPLRSSALWAGALEQLAKDYEILLVVRNQYDWTESIFKQLVHIENRFRKRFRFDQIYGPNGFIPFCELDWCELVETWQSFGFEVKVLPYELLLQNRDEFFLALGFPISRESIVNLKRMHPPHFRHVIQHAKKPVNLDKYLSEVIRRSRVSESGTRRLHPETREEFWEQGYSRTIRTSNERLLRYFDHVDSIRASYGC